MVIAMVLAHSSLISVVLVGFSNAGGSNAGMPWDWSCSGETLSMGVSGAFSMALMLCHSSSVMVASMVVPSSMKGGRSPNPFIQYVLSLSLSHI